MIISQCKMKRRKSTFWGYHFLPLFQQYVNILWFLRTLPWRSLPSFLVAMRPTSVTMVTTWHPQTPQWPQQSVAWAHRKWDLSGFLLSISHAQVSCRCQEKVKVKYFLVSFNRFYVYGVWTWCRQYQIETNTLASRH